MKIFQKTKFFVIFLRIKKKIAIIYNIVDPLKLLNYIFVNLCVWSVVTVSNS